MALKWKIVEADNLRDGWVARPHPPRFSLYFLYHSIVVFIFLRETIACSATSGLMTKHCPDLVIHSKIHSKCNSHKQ